MARSVANSVFERAQQALQGSAIGALRRLKVERVDGTLVISGSVETFYLKQMAQEIVRTVSSDCELQNSIDVHYDTGAHVSSRSDYITGGNY